MHVHLSVKAEEPTRTFDFHVRSFFPASNVYDGEERARLVESKKECVELFCTTYLVTRHNFEQSGLVKIDS
jgi:hypothetical protein